MNNYSLIDPKTAAKARMTPEEAQAVIELWSLQHRLQENPDGPSLLDMAEGLTIPPSEVNRYLRQIRSARRQTTRPVRPIAADVRLALAAMATIVLVVASIASAANYRNSTRRGFPMPSAPRIAPNGMRLTEYPGYFRGDWYMDDAVISPDRYAFSVGSRVYQPMKPIKSEAEELKAAIRSCVGGTLATTSTVWSEALDKQTIDDALAQRPSEPGSGRPFRPRTSPSSSPTPEELITWDEVQVALDHKMTRAQFPYARIADPQLQKAVQQEQDRLIESLAKAAIDLKGRG